MKTNACVSAVSLIFFENISLNFEAKNHSTFSTLSTNLIIKELINKITLIQNTTFFYKNQKKSVFSTLLYIFYTLIANSDLQNAENVICRKMMACRKCRTY